MAAKEPIPHDARAGVEMLLVEDDEPLRLACASALEAEGYRVLAAARGDDAVRQLRGRGFDIVLLDWRIIGTPGIDVLRAALDTRPDTLVIVMTGRPSLQSSLDALQAGAWDYLPKPFTPQQFEILVGRAAHAVLVARESVADQRRLESEAGVGKPANLIGVSPAFRAAMSLARRVATTDASVFLMGESGSGKELIAEYIHARSRRSARRFVPVNCAALPEALLESEMFGHARGAFTGAHRDKVGLLEAADGGTLFLDELLEMAPSVQAKLLRVIQDGVVRRLGSEEPDAVVNLRIIAATNRSPEEAVAAGVLRKDLYFRLRVVPIVVPPLRQRPEDIPLLAHYFLSIYWRRHRGSGLPVPRFGQEAMWALVTHPWPGNVRQLQNLVEHAVVLLTPGAEIRPEDLPRTDRPAASGAPADPASPVAAAPGAVRGEGYYAARDRLVAEFGREYLTRAVRIAGGNVSRAARLARVDRTSFYRLLERHGLRGLTRDDPP